MHFRQKLTFMALGSILTLAGYLLATPTSNITAESGDNIISPFSLLTAQDATFDVITCNRLIVANAKGIPAVDIHSDFNGGLVKVVKANGKTVVEIGVVSGGYIDVRHASGKTGVTIGINASKDGGGAISVHSKKGRGAIQLTSDRYGGKMGIYRNTDDNLRLEDLRGGYTP